jgi:hypothetical protein
MLESNLTLTRSQMNYTDVDDKVGSGPVTASDSNLTFTDHHQSQEEAPS